MSKKILVTGGSGLIGQHLVKILNRASHFVKVLDPKKPHQPVPAVHYIQGSILNEHDAKEALEGVEIVYHLAALTELWSPNPERYRRVNQIGTRSMLKFSEQSDVNHFIHVSSTTVFQGKGNVDDSIHSPSPLPVDQQLGPYPRSKRLAEKEVEQVRKQGFPVTIVRPGAPIGPAVFPLGAPNRMLLSFLNDKFPAYFNAQLNLVDVRDAARGLANAGLKNLETKNHLLVSARHTLSELLQMLEQLTGFSMPQFQIPYWAGMATAMVQQAYSKLISGNQPQATRTGVRLGQYSKPLENHSTVDQLGYKNRPLKQTLIDTIEWFHDQDLLTRPLQTIPQ